MVLSILRRAEVAPEPVVVESPPPVVPFAAYAPDCRLRGFLELSADRLTDLLNGSTELGLTDVVVESLADGRTLHLANLVVDRDELCLVVAYGPRGDPTRRIRTRTEALEVHVGPYHVRGSIHGGIPTDPLANLQRRPPFVPMTDATISFQFAGARIEAEAPALLANLALSAEYGGSHEANQQEPEDLANTA